MFNYSMLKFGTCNYYIKIYYSISNKKGQFKNISKYLFLGARAHLRIAGVKKKRGTDEKVLK